ncbi:MAG: TetR/AcrR family transcriptional regulator [Nitrospirae bacterium]|nr:TetR/AcrR family transcriptional regulator [Nitrospirota bacterium]
MHDQTTRDRILESALHLFSTKGYIGATTKEIAKKAGLAEVTLFRHFRSKEKLFETVLNSYTFLPDLKGLLPQVSDKPYEESLLIIAERFYDKLSERKEMIQLVQAEVQRYPEKLLKTYQKFIYELWHTLALYLNELQKKRIITKLDPEIGARAFLGMCFAYFNAQELMLNKTPDKKTKDETLKGFVQIFVRGTTA